MALAATEVFTVIQALRLAVDYLDTLPSEERAAYDEESLHYLTLIDAESLCEAAQRRGPERMLLAQALLLGARALEALPPEGRPDGLAREMRILLQKRFSEHADLFKMPRGAYILPQPGLYLLH